MKTPKKDTLFTPGPVMMDPASLDLGARQMIYHRTAEFSDTILNCQRMLKAAAGAAGGDRVVILTASGTAAMEAAVLNLLPPSATAYWINGGDFGKRFGEICRCHGAAEVEISLEPGRQIRPSDLPVPDGPGGVLLVNHHETSTGTVYDLDLLSHYCRQHGLLLVVDAIGSFLADPLAMTRQGIDALLFSSQKALGLPPGLSFAVLNHRALARARAGRPRSYYFNFRRYLEDGERGQTPFTPAIGIIRQLERRLQTILERGTDRVTASVRTLAEDFRGRLDGLPFRLFSESPSNALTALQPTGGLAPDYYVRRLREHGCTVCPNGGDLGRKIFRVGHLGALAVEDNARLVAALRAVVAESARVAVCA